MCIFFGACSKDEIINSEDGVKEHVVIVYMAADNNLDKYAWQNINKMESGMVTNENNSLIVYIDPENDGPKIYDIKKDYSENIVSPVIKTYVEHNSADPLILNQVLTDIIDMYPAKSYSLILWSHGTGWLPPMNTLRAFGEDNTNEMDIRDLEVALPFKFNYIIFDACMMGSVEVMYQLRNKADYILASPTDILTEGFPYDSIIPYLFLGEAGLIKTAEKFYDYYNNKSDDAQSATISLVKTKELSRLAELNYNLFSDSNISKSECNIDSVQKLDMFVHPLCFDYYDFLLKNFNDNAQLTTIQDQISKTVIFKASTKQFLGKITINTFCGLSCYVPSQYYDFLNNYYKNLSWSNDSGFFYLIE